MRTYEFTFLTKEKEEKKEVEDLIKKFKGKILNKIEWGQKTLSYPIKRLKKAWYFIYTISFDEKKLDEFKQKLNFSEKILRYLLLKIEK